MKDASCTRDDECNATTSMGPAVPVLIPVLILHSVCTDRGLHSSCRCGRVDLIRNVEEAEEG